MSEIICANCGKTTNTAVCLWYPFREDKLIIVLQCSKMVNGSKGVDMIKLKMFAQNILLMICLRTKDTTNARNFRKWKFYS